MKREISIKQMDINPKEPFLCLYFRNSYGMERVIGNPKIQEDISKIKKEIGQTIDAFLKQHNYISYYTRIWYNKEKEEWIYDVGSWNEFFVLKGAGPNFYNDMEGKK